MSLEFQNTTDKTNTSKIRPYVWVIYDLFTGNRIRHYVIYGITLLIALIYAMYNELVLERPRRHIVYEAAAIAILLLLTLPIARRLTKKRGTERPTPLMLLFAALAIMLVAGGGSFLALTLLQLQSSVKASNEIIERTSSLLEKANAVLKETNFELQRRELTKTQMIVKVTAREPAKIFGDNVVIRLVGTQKVDLDPAGFRVTATIESPNRLDMSIIDAAVDTNKIYKYASRNTGYIIKIVKADEVSASFLIDRSVDKSSS